jgi:hypothetical protein
VSQRAALLVRVLLDKEAKQGFKGNQKPAAKRKKWKKKGTRIPRFKAYTWY